MLKIHKFAKTEADYQGLFRLIDAIWPDQRVDQETFLHGEANRNPNHYFRREWAEMDGQMVACATFNETWWTKTENEYRVTVSVLPDYQNRGIGATLYEQALAQLAADGKVVAVLQANTREDRPEAIQFLEKRGFELDNRYPRSELRLEQFAAPQFASYVERARANGFDIRPLAEIMKTDAEWQRKIYELEWIFEQDEPTPDPPTKIPFDEWARDVVEAPDFMPTGWAIALDGDRYAGMSCLWPDKHFPDRLHTGWTGVDRPYRKQGLATALKLEAIKFARAYGATHIRTDNHEANWMYQINRRLGFKPLPAWISYRKKVGQGQNGQDYCQIRPD